METSFLVGLLREGIGQVLMLILPILGVALIVGLYVAIFQATTSIQEQTLTFLPKLLAIFAMLFLLSNWMFTEISEWTIRLFLSIGRMN